MSFGGGSPDSPHTLLRTASYSFKDSNCSTDHVTKGDLMADLERTVWTAPVRNLVWVACQFGHR
jgi:hypothetical protein